VSVDSTFSSSRFEKSISQSWWRKRASKTRTLINEKERMKKEDEKARTEKASFFQANGKREKQLVFLQKRV
jgi:hypothetical protein